MSTSTIVASALLYVMINHAHLLTILQVGVQWSSLQNSWQLIDKSMSSYLWLSMLSSHPSLGLGSYPFIFYFFTTLLLLMTWPNHHSLFLLITSRTTGSIIPLPVYPRSSFLLLSHLVTHLHMYDWVRAIFQTGRYQRAQSLDGLAVNKKWIIMKETNCKKLHWHYSVKNLALK